MSEEGRPGFEWHSFSHSKQFAGVRRHLASSERLIDSPLLTLALRNNAGPSARASEGVRDAWAAARAAGARRGVMAAGRAALPVSP